MNIGFYLWATSWQRQYGSTGDYVVIAVKTRSSRTRVVLWTPSPLVNLFHMKCTVRRPDMKGLLKIHKETPLVMSLVFRLKVRAATPVDSGWGVVVETANGHMIRVNMWDFQAFSVRMNTDKRNLVSLYRMKDLP